MTNLFFGLTSVRVFYPAPGTLTILVIVLVAYLVVCAAILRFGMTNTRELA